jgi:hypothetical protein
MGQFFARFRKSVPAEPFKPRAGLSDGQVAGALTLAKTIEKVSAGFGRDRGAYLDYPRDEPECMKLGLLRR